jgi:hypothetical protein
MDLSTKPYDSITLYGDTKSDVFLRYIDKTITDTKEIKKVIFTNPQLDALIKKAFNMGYTENEICDIFAKALMSSMGENNKKFKYLISDTG